MIIASLHGEFFKKYSNIQDARKDIIEFFNFCTSYKEQKTVSYCKFINNLRYLDINKFNKLDYTIKFYNVNSFYDIVKNCK